MIEIRLFMLIIHAVLVFFIGQVCFELPSNRTLLGRRSNPQTGTIHVPRLYPCPYRPLYDWIGFLDAPIHRHVGPSRRRPLFLSLFVKLKEWARSLPAHLQLPFSAGHTAVFNREIHQLHLPYLTSITLLHLSKSTQPLPKACTAGILAASCVARIFEDFLTRGSLRFLQGMAVEYLSAAADQQIGILRLALKEMAKTWHSSKMFDAGFERLLSSAQPAHGPETTGLSNQAGEESHMAASMLAELVTHGGGVDVLDYFPYATGNESAVCDTDG
ncbi:hypothetical protein VTN00DRAFT_695 [Thermoascus crustaceus]|uniref:uncharacterized protein n=1 Tax=Thermoascus crustaceus TaxID=5088 RepID=UPI003743C7F9